MPEESRGQGAQQEGQQQANQSEAEEDDDDPTTWKPERAAQTIKAQRESEKELARKLAAAEKRAKALEDAGKTAEQKTVERLSALEARVVTSDLKEALTKAGALNSVAAAKLVDRDGLDPESNDYEARVADAIKAVKAEAPELFKNNNNNRGSADQGARGKSGPADMNSLIRSRI